MFSKIEVNGDGACELYQFLKSGNPGGDGNEDIAWNFSKFLVGKNGEVLERFDPTVTPEEIGEKVAGLP
jgi:glutathione peroxidase